MTARTYLLCHAHPDDETLATGAIALALRARGDDVAVLTATRGEQGEVRPGPYAALEGTPELAAIREAELREALHALGASAHAYLGEGAARAAHAMPRRYTDSGMRWVTPTMAGPGDDAGPDSLTTAEEAEVAADIAAFASAIGATDLVSYSDDGGYGHPDHIRMHHATQAAAASLGLPFHVIVTDPDEAHDEWLDASGQRDALDRAYDAYATQFSRDGDAVTHVGGQADRVITAAGLRRA
ncbi:MAG TPA: PIG-L family deacetylase [Propionibacteriaceae bacterium]|nr:PIG-L family deacetylase [Propionibacteriaceae bacterium]